MSANRSQQINFNSLYKQKQQLHIYLNRQCINLPHPQQIQDNTIFLKQLLSKLNEQNQIIKMLSFKLINFIDFCFKIKEEYQESFNQMSYQVEIKDGNIYNLQEANNHLEQKQQFYALQYQKLKSQIILLSQKFDKQQNQSKNQLINLTSIIKEAQQIAQKDKYLISTLINEKKILIDQIKNERKFNIDLNNQLHQYQLKVQEFGKLEKFYEGRLLELTKINRQFERVIEEKGLVIEKLENQIRGYREYFVEKNNNDEHNPTLDMDYMQNKDTKASLCEQIPFLEHQAPKALCRNLSQLSLYTLKTYRKSSNDQDYKNTYKMILDPYYAHFVLTSQSVKIRQDCQTLLNIDVKPFYKQIIQKRIPMHLWDQWIRNKLKQILKQLKKYKPQQLDQDYQG